MDKKINHLEMIQGVINRMAYNSFALKGWALTLVIGIFALAGKDTDIMYFRVVPYIPIIVFWGLDSYYLLQERLYRALYEKVRLLPDIEINFSMETSLEEFASSNCTFHGCFFSKTELLFYLSLAIAVTITTCLC